MVKQLVYALIVVIGLYLPAKSQLHVRTSQFIYIDEKNDFLSVYDLPSGILKKSFKLVKDDYSNAKFSADDTYFFFLGTSSTTWYALNVENLELTSEKLFKSEKEEYGMVFSLGITQNDQAVLRKYTMESSDGVAEYYVYDCTKTGKLITHFKNQNNGFIVNNKIGFITNNGALDLIDSQNQTKSDRIDHFIDTAILAKTELNGKNPDIEATTQQGQVRLKFNLVGSENYFIYLGANTLTKLHEEKAQGSTGKLIPIPSEGNTVGYFYEKIKTNTDTLSQVMPEYPAFTRQIELLGKSKLTKQEKEELIKIKEDIASYEAKKQKYLKAAEEYNSKTKYRINIYKDKNKTFKILEINDSQNISIYGKYLVALNTGDVTIYRLTTFSKLTTISLI
jgi:hypothetical protein